jgi:hypothetical protein
VEAPGGAATPETNGGGIGDCINDQFSVSSNGLSGTPNICGINTGQHGNNNDIWPVHLVWMTARLQQDTFLSWHLAPASEVAGGHTLPF